MFVTAKLTVSQAEVLLMAFLEECDKAGIEVNANWSHEINQFALSVPENEFEVLENVSKVLNIDLDVYRSLDEYYTPLNPPSCAVTDLDNHPF